MGSNQGGMRVDPALLLQRGGGKTVMVRRKKDSAQLLPIRRKE